MSDRFDLEQEILECWKITSDITLLEQMGANTADMTSLATIYEYKFEKLWQTFEKMCHERQFVSMTQPAEPKKGKK